MQVKYLMGFGVAVAAGNWITVTIDGCLTN